MSKSKKSGASATTSSSSNVINTPGVDPSSILMFSDEDEKILASLSKEEIERLAALQLREEESTAVATHRQPPAVSGTRTVVGANNQTRTAKKKGAPFTFTTLVEKVLTPEQRLGGPDAIGEALFTVKIVELQDCHLQDTDVLECLGGATQCYLQHNQIQNLKGLQLVLTLTTLVVHHNQLVSLADLADLPHLTYLDASENRIEELDVETHLPVETLKYLNLRGNPCAPRYEGTEFVGDDAEYGVEYRNSILRACQQLKLLDDIAVSTAAREELGVGAPEPSLLTMMSAQQPQQKQSQPQQQQQDPTELLDGAGASRDTPEVGEPDDDDEGAMTTNVADSDFVLPGEGDDEDNDDFAAEDRKRTAVAETEGGGGGGGDSDDDGVSPSPPPPSQDPSTASKSKPPLQRRGGSGGKRSSEPTAPQQQPPPQQTLTHRLLAQYDRVRSERKHLVSRLSGAEEEVDPTDEQDEEWDDGFRKAGAEKQQLSRELRQAQEHHSNTVQQSLTTLWDGVHKDMGERQLRAQQRRMEMRERLSKPSAGYLAALALLEKESGGSLEKYRSTEETPKQ